MTDKKCDMCGETCGRLNELTLDYKQDDISEICDSCLNESNNLLSSCLNAQNIQRINFVRKFMKKLRIDKRSYR